MIFFCLQQQQQRFPPVMHRSISSPTSYVQIQGTGTVPSSVGNMDQPIGLQQSLVSRDQNSTASMTSSMSIPGTPPPTGTMVTSGSTAMSIGGGTPTSAGGVVNAMKGQGASTPAGGTNSNSNAYLNREEVSN